MCFFQRFKFESGRLKDVSEQPVLLRSVDQLIEVGNVVIKSSLADANVMECSVKFQVPDLAYKLMLLAIGIAGCHKIL